MTWDENEWRRCQKNEIQMPLGILLRHECIYFCNEINFTFTTSGDTDYLPIFHQKCFDPNVMNVMNGMFLPDAAQLGSVCEAAVDQWWRSPSGGSGQRQWRHTFCHAKLSWAAHAWISQVIHLKPKLSTILLNHVTCIDAIQLTALDQQSPPCAADSPAPNDQRAAVAAQDQREQPLQDGDQSRVILVVFFLVGQQQCIK